MLMRSKQEEKKRKEKKKKKSMKSDIYTHTSLLQLYLH